MSANHPTTNRLLLDEYPLIVQPSLAKALGLHEALILQQIHYWLQRSTNLEEGRHWVFNSYAQWADQMPFLTPKQIRTAIGNLREKRILLTGNWNTRPGDQTLWYSIDYAALDSIIPLAQMGIPVALQGTPHAPQGKPLPETTTETSPPEVPSSASARKPSQKKGICARGSDSEEFTRFWRAYPKDAAKAAARSHWNARLKEGEAAEGLITCAANYAQSCQDKGTAEEFIMHASTFLGTGKRYEEHRTYKELANAKHPQNVRREGTGNGGGTPRGLVAYDESQYADFLREPGETD